jgi:hypothetical protein
MTSKPNLPLLDRHDAYALATVVVTQMIDAVRRDPDVSQDEYFWWCLLFAPLTERIATVIHETVNRFEVPA